MTESSDLGAKAANSFNEIKVQFEKSVEQLRECVGSTNEKLETKLKFLKEEVEIRVESIKIELDVLAESLITRLSDELNSYWDGYKSEVRVYEDDLDILKSTKSNLDQQAEVYFNEYQTKIDKINELMSNLNAFTSQIEFKPSEKTLDSRCIGDLTNSIENNNLIKRIKQNKPKLIEIDSYPTDLYSLEYTCKTDVDGDGAVETIKTLLLVCDVGSIKVFNENFNVLKTIQKIGTKDISPGCIASNRVDRIFMRDLNDHSVIMCDFDFNFIKQIGSYGDTIGNFDHVVELEYYNQQLFVCDCYNQRIQCFNASDLDFQKSYQLAYEPNQMKIYNDVACVLGQSVLYFYDLSCFTLIKAYDTGDCSIGLVNRHYIYELSYETNKFKFYSLLNGERLFELSDTLGELEPVEYDDRRSMTWFNGKLVVSLSSGKLFVF